MFWRGIKSTNYEGEKVRGDSKIWPRPVLLSKINVHMGDFGKWLNQEENSTSEFMALGTHRASRVSCRWIGKQRSHSRPDRDRSNSRDLLHFNPTMEDYDCWFSGAVAAAAAARMIVTRPGPENVICIGLQKFWPITTIILTGTERWVLNSCGSPSLSESRSHSRDTIHLTLWFEKRAVVAKRAMVITWLTVFYLHGQLGGVGVNEQLFTSQMLKWVLDASWGSFKCYFQGSLWLKIQPVKSD